jgi:GNAT superfamily N-acetyltransferase
VEVHRVEEERPEDVRQFLEDRINAHNIAATGVGDDVVVARTIRDEAAAVVVGLSGWTWGGTLCVEHLWIDEARHRHGNGSRRLRAAEEQARARGCAQSLLSTHSFQGARLLPHAWIRGLRCRGRVPQRL